MDDQHTDFVQPISPAAAAVPDKVLETPEAQLRYMHTVQHVTYILGGIAGVGVAGVFILAAFVPTLPDTVVLLGSSVASMSVGGLVGFIAGRNDGA